MAGLAWTYYARKKLSTRRKFIIILAGSLVLRFALATFTGHAWDMEQWTQTARRYFESGQFTLQSFPTLPVYYFMLLGSYSWYALLRLAGMPDLTFMFLPSRAIESIFIIESTLLLRQSSFDSCIPDLSYPSSSGNSFPAIR